jgi:hypothetical protein
VAFNRIKIKQLQSGNEIFGKVIKSDGSGNTIWSDVIEKGTTFPSNPTGVHYIIELTKMLYFIMMIVEVNGYP